jgi:predicted RNA methylase
MIYTDSGKELKLNDDLKAGEKVNVTVEISYTKALDDSFKSSDDIIIELLDTSLTYSKK